MKLRYRIGIGILVTLTIAIVAIAVTLSYESPCPPTSAKQAGPETMRAAIYRCYGSPDVVEVANVDKPVPGASEMLIRVSAAGVNPYDWHHMRGSPYIMRLGTGIGGPAEIRLGRDFAGTVEAVGENVSRFAPGDAVFGGAAGAFAEYVVVREDGPVARKPRNVSFAQAAAVPIAALTALQALRDHGQLESGQRVLINGASGGVGTFAVQIAKYYGAEVSGVCSTRNVEMVRMLGADRVFDYRKEDYTQSDAQFDLIVDMVGNHSALANRRVMKDSGRMVLVGAPKGDWIAPIWAVLKAVVVSKFVEQDLSMMLASMNSDDLEVLADLMESGYVTPVLDREFPLSQLRDALAYSESGRARGKIVITTD